MTSDASSASPSARGNLNCALRMALDVGSTIQPGCGEKVSGPSCGVCAPAAGASWAGASVAGARVEAVVLVDCGCESGSAVHAASPITRKANTHVEIEPLKPDLSG